MLKLELGLAGGPAGTPGGVLGPGEVGEPVRGGVDGVPVSGSLSGGRAGTTAGESSSPLPAVPVGLVAGPAPPARLPPPPRGREPTVTPGPGSCLRLGRAACFAGGRLDR